MSTYLQVDPLLLEGHSPERLQAFSYALNRPIQLTDPYGLLTFDTRAAKACSPEMTKKWIKAYEHIRTMAEDCECRRQFSEQYGVDLKSLIQYSSPGPRVVFRETVFSNSAGEYSDGSSRIDLSCARFSAVTTPLAIARTFIHELAHYANDPAGQPDGRAPQSNDKKTHGGAYRAEDACVRVLMDKYGFDALISEAL